MNFDALALLWVEGSRGRGLPVGLRTSGETPWVPGANFVGVGDEGTWQDSFLATFWALRIVHAAGESHCLCAYVVKEK